MKKQNTPPEVSDDLVSDQRVIDDLGFLQIEGQPDIIFELAASFFDTFPKKMEDISKRLSEGNLKEAAAHAHSMKSSAYTLGMMRLGRVCQKLEDLAESKEVKEGVALYSLIQIEYSQAAPHLAQISSNLSPIYSKIKRAA